MNILVYVDQLSGAATSLSKELITAARHVAGADGKVDLALIGGDPSAVANLGADRILHMDGEAVERYNPSIFAACMNGIVQAQQPDLILFGYCTAGLDLAPYIAINRDLPLVSYCTAIRLDGRDVETESQIYGGKMVATSKSAMPAILVVNPGAYREAEPSTANQSEIVAIPLPAGIDQSGIVFIRATEPDPNAIDITKSDRLLCVGRGIGDQDSIEDARRAADLLGAELVGSRPIVDAGWLPKERQVGKSGRKVKPRLYMALGVSGAPEHLEGMRSSGMIVAINSDAKAPIFDHAHFGATLDVADFIEALSEALDK